MLVFRRSLAQSFKEPRHFVHFAIDNDGTIYQFMDCNHIAWHAGSSKWNNNSVGVEIANAYYPKHQGWYKSKGFGERPYGKTKGSWLNP